MISLWICKYYSKCINNSQKYRLEINADKKICNQKEFYTFCLTFLGDAYQLSSGLTYCQQTAKKYYKLIQRGLA